MTFKECRTICFDLDLNMEVKNILSYYDYKFKYNEYYFLYLRKYSRIGEMIRIPLKDDDEVVAVLPIFDDRDYMYCSKAEDLADRIRHCIRLIKNRIMEDKLKQINEDFN